MVSWYASVLSTPWRRAAGGTSGTVGSGSGRAGRRYVEAHDGRVRRGGRRCWSSTSRTTSPTPPARCPCAAPSTSSPAVNEEVAAADGRRGDRRLHAGLAPAADAALRDRRRTVAGALRARHVGCGVPPRPRRGRRVGAQGHGRRGRLQRLHDARPDVRRGGVDRARRAAACRGIEHVAVVGLALDYCVRATALDAVARGYGCVVPRRATAPVEVEPGDGGAAEAELAAAGVDVDDD